MTTESTETAQGAAAGPAEPPIRVVRGNPTPEELAAALAVVQVRASAAASDQLRRPEPSAWSAPARNMPGPLPTPGPGAWRRMFWPG